jgi:alkyl hydroperoxide reductase subunit F
MTNEYDLVIIGGGPAGAAAGVYAARKQIRTALICESFGGQSVESDNIQNWLGTPSISGVDLAKKLRGHVLSYAGEFVEVKEGEKVVKVESQASETEQNSLVVTTSKGVYKAKTLLVTTGGSRRKLDIEGAAEFEGKGITYCASCDGPFYAGKDVVVVGGGNAGFESAAQLLTYCSSVTLLSRGDFRADPITVEKVLAKPKMKAARSRAPSRARDLRRS